MKYAAVSALLLLLAAAAHAFTPVTARAAAWPARTAPSMRLQARKGAASKQEMQLLQQTLTSEFDITHLEALLARYKRTVTYRFKGAVRAMRILERPIKKGSVIDAKRMMERFFTARQQLWTDIQHYQDRAARLLAEGDRPLALHYIMGAELLRFLDPVAKMASVYLYTAQNDDISKVERLLKAAAIVGPDPVTLAQAEGYKQERSNATTSSAAPRRRKTAKAATTDTSAAAEAAAEAEAAAAETAS